jgi:hypothetical protein
MVNVWPTIDVLKTLRKGGKLSLEASKSFDAAMTATEDEAKVGYLAECMAQTCSESALLQDFRSKYDQNKADTHKAMTAAAKQSVYECRDKNRPAWRGAVIFPEGCEDAWMIFVDTHEHFHNAGPRSLKHRRSAGSIGPDDLDRSVRDICVEDIERREQHRQLFEAFIDALRQTVDRKDPVSLTLPKGGIFEGGGATLSVSKWDTELDPESAHEEVPLVTLTIARQTHYEAKKFIAKVGTSFIQPADGEYYAIGRGEIYEFLVSGARLIQLMALAKKDIPTEDIEPPEPTVLHYVMKKRLAEAYVEGKAVQAVCGEWWVPVGDEITHNDLPVCPRCEAEQKVAQALEDLRHQFGQRC